MPKSSGALPKSLALQSKRRKIMVKGITVSSAVSSAVLAGVLLFTTSAPVIASPGCGNLQGCEKKFCEIERQLKIAQEKGNAHKADGLRRSLNNAKENCTDKGLKADLIEEISAANEEIEEYESDLKEAKEYGKTDKIRKYNDKIKEEKSKINRLEDKLSELD